MKVKNILFDLDGTILEPSDGIINSILFALKKLEIPIPETKSLKKLIGPTLMDSFQGYFGMDKQMANKAIEYYREYFSTKGINENELYSGFDVLLKDLHQENVRMFVATSKPTIFAQRIIESHSLTKFFQQVVGSNMNNTRTNKYDIIKYVLDENNLQSSETIMVGDRSFDIVGAIKNGLESVGVTYGHGSKTELQNAGADQIVNTVQELSDLLKIRTRGN